MDETSIRLYQKTGPGFLVQVARKHKRSAKGLSANVNKGTLRGAFTHMAMVCDDEDLQKSLPQVVFMNKAFISQTDFDSVTATLLPDVRAHRVDNPWTTNDKMKIILKELADAMKRLTPGRRVVLSAGGYKAHIATSTWAAAAPHGFFYFIVPPKLTWASQPCDTHVFATFKNHLSTTCQGLATDNGTPGLDTVSLMKALNTTIGDTLNQKSWRRAFSDLGFRGSQLIVTP